MRAHGLAEAAAGQGRAAAARVVRDDQGKALVLRPGPQRGLAQARVAHHADARVIDLVVGLKVVQRPAQAPGPGADGAPLVRRGLGLALGVKEGVYAVLEPVVKVGVQVAAIDRGQGIATLEQAAHRPAGGADAARGFRGPVVDDAHSLPALHPLGGQGDAGIGLDGVVAEKVQADERGRRSGSGVGQVDEQVHLELSGQVDRYLFAGRRAVERCRVDRGHLKAHLGQRARRFAIDLLLEQPEDLGPAPFRPGLGVGDRGPIQEGEGIG